MRVDYSDSTPDVGYGYDRRGRQITTTNDTMLVCSLAYNDANQLLTEVYSSGPLSGLSVTNGYDQFLRRTNLSAMNGSTFLSRSAHSYDAASRLQTVSDGTNRVGYVLPCKLATGEPDFVHEQRSPAHRE